MNRVVIIRLIIRILALIFAAAGGGVLTHQIAGCSASVDGTHQGGFEWPSSNSAD